jgi:hypothetical protein
MLTCVDPDDASRLAVENEDSTQGALFRRRFRVPYVLFAQIVALARPWFNSVNKVNNVEAVALELKVKHPPVHVLTPLACAPHANRCDAHSFSHHTRIRVPQVLGVLRVLARGAAFDDIAECTNTSEEIHRLFFAKFVVKFACTLWPQWCSPPEDPTSAEGTHAPRHRRTRMHTPGIHLCIHVHAHTHARSIVWSMRLEGLLF